MNEPLRDSEIADSGDIDEDRPERRLVPQILIGVVVLLTLIGVLLVPGEAPEETPAGTEAPSLLGEQTNQSRTDGDPNIDRSRIESGTGLSQPGAQARALIASQRTSGETDLEALHAAAVEAESAGNLADAYLLYFFAAREGHAASALVLGNQADPAGHDPAKSLLASADLIQAHKWYQMAAQSGNDEAQERLADLRARVTQLAAQGDPQAQQLALTWR